MDLHCKFFERNDSHISFLQDASTVRLTMLGPNKKMARYNDVVDLLLYNVDTPGRVSSEYSERNEDSGRIIYFTFVQCFLPNL